jgi:cysteine desulfurase
MTVTGDTELVYLDHAASTPMRPAAVDAMVRVLRDEPANPTGAHRLARRIRQSLEEAREQIASALEVPAREIVFCGNGSEANNLAIDGVRGDGLSVCAAAEHHAVLHPIEHAGGIVVPVDAAGAMDRDALKSVLAEHGDRVRIISAMAVNNEVGTITALAQVASTMRKKAPKSVLHCDAVQAPSWVDLAELCRHADLVSLSAHKFGGPKGVGILRIRSGVSVEAQIRGGGQEAERRSGTQDVASAVAMATALTECVARRDDELVRIAHVCVEGVEAESLVFLLDRAGVCASAGSSCASGATQISHVLAAIGVPMSIARGSLRLSLGWTTTQADIDRAVVAVVESVEQLRRVA